MPKKIYKIDQFHGGLNTHSEWRDIANDELSKATDIQVEHVGKIKLMGGLSDTSISKTGIIRHGYGLFSFSADRQHGHTGNDTRVEADGGGVIDEQSGNNIENDYLILYDNQSSSGVRKINIYSYGSGDLGGFQPSDTFAHTFPVVSGDDTKPVFYQVDGVVRFSDGYHYPYKGTRKWYGYIYRSRWRIDEGDRNVWSGGGVSYSPPTFVSYGGNLWQCNTSHTSTNNSNQSTGHPADNHFNWDKVSSDETAYEVVDTWLMDDPEPKPPTAYLFFYNNSNGINRAGVGVVSYISTPGAVGYPTIYLQNTGSGTGWNKDWDVAYSWVYDGNQESPLKRIASATPWNGVGSAGCKISVYFRRELTDAGTVSWPLSGRNHARITGLNIYLRENGTDTYFLQAELDLYTGIKDITNRSTNPWQLQMESSTSPVTWRYKAITDLMDAPSKAISYETNTGISQDATTLAAHYTSAVVANRMAYIGNVTINEDGKDIHKSDAMMKSMPNRFDTFTSNRMIEASVNDGDSIITLETYADRILQFKKRKMHLINISQEIEFLEETYMHKGVLSPNAVCKTDFGVAWINKNGCYFYNSKEVTNLFEKKGRKLISMDDWTSFYTSESMIGFIPKTRKLIIVKDSHDQNGDIYMFDFATQSWVFGDSVFPDNVDKTNFVRSSTGDLLVGYESGNNIQIAEWSDTPQTTTTLDIRTKDIDFDLPTTRKKIYKIYITHKNAGQANVRLRAEIMSAKATSGQGVGEVSNWTSFSNFVEDRSAGDDQVDSWITQIFIPPSTDDGGNAINWSNVYSLRLYILPYTSSQNVVQTVPAGFEINDICIVYRPKAVK